MAWFDITNPSFWEQPSGYMTRGTWNGTEWVPDSEGRIRWFFKDQWMDGQPFGHWRFTLNVASGALGNTGDMNAFVLDESFIYNWEFEIELSFSLSVGSNTIKQVVFFEGANSHLGNVRAFNIDGRDGLVYTLTKIEWSDVLTAETSCILYKHTGFSLSNLTTDQSTSLDVDGSDVAWKKSVTSLSGRWLDPIRPGAMWPRWPRGSTSSSPQLSLPDISTSDSLFLLANHGNALITEKDETTSGIVTGKGNTKIPVFQE